MREWLIFARRRKDLSQGEVANQAAISRAFYAQLESGVRSPSPIVAKRVAGVLDLPGLYFMRIRARSAMVPMRSRKPDLYTGWFADNIGNFFRLLPASCVTLAGVF